LYVAIFIGSIINAIQKKYDFYLLSGNINYLIVQRTFVVYIFTILVLVVFYIYFMRSIKGINAGEVFIWGDSRAGKSVFVTTLFNYLVNHNFGEVPDEIIIAGSENDEARLTLPQMGQDIIEGNPPKQTDRNELALYKLKGTVQGLLRIPTPIQITMFDYSGSFIRDITKEKYDEAITKCIELIPGENQKTLSTKFGQINFLMNLKEKYREIFDNNYSLLVPSMLYDRLIKSGKIIILIKGEYLTGPRNEFVNYLQEVAALIKKLPKNKSYALVVTKADAIVADIKGLNEDSVIADQIEYRTFQDICNDIIIFKAIIHTYEIDFFIVSADNRIERVPSEAPRPWRFKHLVKFIARSI
jgi:hypothetical protein